MTILAFLMFFIGTLIAGNNMTHDDLYGFACGVIVAAIGVIIVFMQLTKAVV